MMALDLDLVVATIPMLLAAAAWLAVTRSHADVVGPVAGVLTLAAGLGAVLLHGPAPSATAPILDAVSLPLVSVTGIVLTATFLAVPRRFLTASSSAALLASAAVHLALAMAPGGLPSGGLWAVGCALALFVLPSGPARRLALPYLAIAAGAGVVGVTLGGVAGSALLLLAVAVRMGVFPFHSWAVGAYTLGPTAWAVAVVAPMQAIALVARAPLALGEADLVVAGLLVAAAVLATGLALVQDELARAVGFLTVAVEAVVLVGVLDTHHVGHIGGLMMWSATALALVGLGLVAGALRARGGPVSLRGYLGLSASAPTFAVLFLVFGLAAVGAPGTADFVSEDLLLHGSLAHHPALLIGLVGAVSLQGYAVLHLFYRVFLGPAGTRLPDALRRERLALWAVAALLVVTGLAPQLLVRGWSQPHGGDDGVEAHDGVATDAGSPADFARVEEGR